MCCIKLLVADSFAQSHNMCDNFESLVALRIHLRNISHLALSLTATFNSTYERGGASSFLLRALEGRDSFGDDVPSDGSAPGGLYNAPGDEAEVSLLLEDTDIFPALPPSSDGNNKKTKKKNAPPKTKVGCN